MTTLKYYKENAACSYYDDIEPEVVHYINEWNKCIAAGEGFCFIKLIDFPYDYEWDRFKDDTEQLSKKLESMIESIQDSEHHYVDRKGAFDDDAVDEEDYSDEDDAQDSNDSDDIDSPDFDDDDDDDYYEDIDDENHSPWCRMLCKALLKHEPVEVVTEHSDNFTLVEQIYDTDVLLQILSEDGSFLGHEYVELSDIRLIRTGVNLFEIDDSLLNSNVINVDYNESAKEALLDYARTNNKKVTIWIKNEMAPVIKNAKIICADDEDTTGDKYLVQIKENGDNVNTWLDYDVIYRLLVK